ncbi:zinc finger and SCAN domain-containing protein 30 [Musca vetustissima]|uniref:zinc finger and SCAN domain-containing protein 30 n=1 Tax=Musca vetustissima TaxID=27455 RepID=UPI002AB659EA|nr:zinc finger and SCAN domain-containing protein 30 [Musca vetustissima]
MCVVINLDVVCLVCLHHSAEMHSIFDTASDENDIQIAQKISTLSKLKVDSKNEHLPDKICDGCLKDLKAAWRFHRNCQTAVAVFQSILKPILKLREQTETKSIENQESEDNVTNEPTSSSSSGEQHGAVEMTIKEMFDEDQPDHQLAAVIESTDEQDIVDESSMVAEEVEEEEEETAVKEETVNKFVELNQCITEEDHEEDFQSVDDGATYETQGLVEYYLTDDNEEIKRVSKAKQPRILKSEKDTSTIASKKMIVQSARDDTNVSTSSMATRGIVTRALERKSEASKIVKFATAARRKQIQYQPATSKTSQQQRIPQQTIDSEDNASQSNAESETSSRKRKAGTAAGTRVPKICEICGNSYRFQHALNAHMRRHFDDKPFPCEMCSKAFVSNVELRRHMRVHTGQKPYACQYCDRRFSDYGSRIKHERTHTGERPYGCATCGKTFAYPHVLSVHLRTHTGEKKFKCSYCPKGFTKKAYLITHMDTYHSNVGDVTTYELTMEDDDGDNVETDNEQLGDAMFTPEFIIDDQQQEHQDRGQIDKSHHHKLEEGDGDDDDNDNNVDDDDNRNAQMLVPKSLLRLKSENNTEDDNDVQEVEIHLDEYTIRVR